MHDTLDERYNGSIHDGRTPPPPKGTPMSEIDAMLLDACVEAAQSIHPSAQRECDDSDYWHVVINHVLARHAALAAHAKGSQ